MFNILETFHFLSTPKGRLKCILPRRKIPHTAASPTYNRDDNIKFIINSY